MERLPEGVSEEQAVAGKKLFGKIGCADCHTPKLGALEGIYSDLLLHSMGEDLVGGGSYGEPPIPVPDSREEGPSPSEWRTPPLWGVADSAPYLHDGRAATLAQAILMHDGQGAKAARRFAALSRDQQSQVIAFLKTLRGAVTIKFVCSCGKHLKAGDDLAARRSVCPRCGFAPVGIPSLTPLERRRNDRNSGRPAESTVIQAERPTGAEQPGVPIWLAGVDRERAAREDGCQHHLACGPRLFRSSRPSGIELRGVLRAQGR